jgi:hypothetical protein
MPAIHYFNRIGMSEERRRKTEKRGFYEGFAKLVLRSIKTLAFLTGLTALRLSSHIDKRLNP